MSIGLHVSVPDFERFELWVLAITLISPALGGIAETDERRWVIVIPVSTMSQWRIRRSSRGIAIFASPETEED